MFDDYAKKLIEKIPELPGLDTDTCRRMLSKAYFYVINIQLGLTEERIEIDDLIQVRQYLRKLSDALESIAVFDRLNGIDISEEVESSCAFVAAEALNLLLSLHSTEDGETTNDLFNRSNNYLAIECALLYMIGGYDINAVSIAQKITLFNINEELDSIKERTSLALLQRICSFCEGNIYYMSTMELLPGFKRDSEINRYDELVDQIRVELYMRSCKAIDSYVLWLRGSDQNGKNNAISILNTIRESTFKSGNKMYTLFADIYHISSILLAAIYRTSKRATMHAVPLPEAGDELIRSNYSTYLKHRIIGGEFQKGRPFLWPSAIEYISSCLPGPKSNAVVSMPTGSGKSFIAELACSHALCDGWVLYLAPTNALAHQIRRDLKEAFRPFKHIKVSAFVGGEEYTTLTEEQIDLDNCRYVAVMTPEKCALALRLYPEKFSSCSLCIFDECHLLNDKDRGITADILLAQLFHLSRNIKFLLMSAMISNPQELAKWLECASGIKTNALTIKWRPSRTMRGLLVLDMDAFDTNYEVAASELARLPKNRKNVKFDVPLGIIAGLSGPWTYDGIDDYQSATLPAKFIAKATKNELGGIYKNIESWKNTASRISAEMFATANIPTINFILSSRHHAFSSANKVQVDIPGAIKDNDKLPHIVKAWLGIADAELGVETVLRELLCKGIAVHSSAMLQCEQAAAEWMFSKRKSILMFATGTLAQGLNLPAVAVVVAGTSMGDARETDKVYGISRANALILNAFGRASRPGFSNQGMAILVSDDCYAARLGNSLNPVPALREYGVMGEQDAAISVESPVRNFIDYMIEDEPVTLGITNSELVLMTLLTELSNDKNYAGHVLSCTLAAYQKRGLLDKEIIDKTPDRLIDLREGFIQHADIPAWLNMAAMKAGVDLLRALDMWNAYNEVGLINTQDCSGYSLVDWLDLLIKVVARLSSKNIEKYLPTEEIKTETVLTKIRDANISRKSMREQSSEFFAHWDQLWNELKDIILLYMEGESYKRIASTYLQEEESNIDNGRSNGASPIPAVFKFLRTVVDRLAIDAGCFLALNEFGIFGEDNSKLIPEELQALSLCIRNGCNSLSVLAWFRFGIRQRVCAHALHSELPIPIHLKNDTERSIWVKARRRAWLSDRILLSDNPLLGFARTIIINE